MSRSYHNYRGRRPAGKTALAVVLALIILVSVGFIFLQEKILFFDETGTAYLQLPGEDPKAEHPQEEEIDLTIQPVESEQQTLRKIRGFVAPAPLDRESWTLSAREAREVLGEDAAVAVTLKDSTGTVHFDSGTALPGTVRFYEEDTDVALNAVLSGSRHTIARISCFHDPKAANREVEAMGLLNTGGFIFYDGNNSQWLDPAKSAAREYLCSLACEAAAMGFDEILLTDFSYPTEGKLDKIALGEVSREQALDAFLVEMRMALEPYSVMLSVEVPEAVILAGSDETAGVSLDELARRVDCVYTPTVPERVQILADAVAQAGDAAFTPELETYSSDWAEHCLIF